MSYYRSHIINYLFLVETNNFNFASKHTKWAIVKWLYWSQFSFIWYVFYRNILQFQAGIKYIQIILSDKSLRKQ